MGSPEGEARREKDEQQKEHVIISKTFEIMTTEVTQLQWFEVMETNPSFFKTSNYCDDYDPINKLCPNHPVEKVSWNDVQVFIKKLNDSLGLYGCHGTPRDKSGCYRLPTEAEWEFAARGGTKTAYSFGNDDSILGDYAWYDKTSKDQTHPVGKLEKNPNGLYDMHGNVWEWVQDKHTENPQEHPAWHLDDPLHTSSGSARVIRGGSWDYDARYLRSANRAGDYPGHGSSYVGFRLLRML